MRKAELADPPSRVPSGSPGAGTPNPRASTRRRSGGGSGALATGGVGRLLRGMVPESSTGTSSSNDSPRRSGTIGGTKGKGKAKATATTANGQQHSGSAPGTSGVGGVRHASRARRHPGGSLEASRREIPTAEQRIEDEAGADSGEAVDENDARIEQLRTLTKSCLEENMPDTAAYYADKLVTFTSFDREAVLLLAKAHFACRAYLRAVHLLAQHRLLDYTDGFGLRACHLAARSLQAADKTEELISLLEKVLGHTDDHAAIVKERAKATRATHASDAPAGGADRATVDRRKPSNGHCTGSGMAAWPTPGVDVFAGLCCLRGQAYANVDNRSRAAVWLRAALEIDARCVEALQCLTRLHLLSIDEQTLMVSKLDYGQPKEESWVHSLFKSQLNRPPGSKAKVFDDLDRVGLGENLDVLAAKAECCYEQNDAQQALDICRQVFRADPHNAACLPVYLAAMVELKMKSQLFYTAHQLVEAGPREAVSWFAVGCYYHLLAKNELAQRYFLKATKLDGRFAPAWIGFGNAFAAQEETDQAVSAYRSAARLFQGSHLPLLYIGMEYVRTHNLALARNFLMGALSLSTADPLVLNELGVVHFASAEYSLARDRFEMVLQIVEGLSSQALEAWESTVFNLGHCHRKLGNLQEAASCYLRARELAPGQHSVHSALALTHHLQGRHDEATSGYHRALGLKPDDPFAAEMLKKALMESFQSEPCAGLTDLMSKTTLTPHEEELQGDYSSRIEGTAADDHSFSFGPETPQPGGAGMERARDGQTARWHGARHQTTPPAMTRRRRGGEMGPGARGVRMDDDSFDQFA